MKIDILLSTYNGENFIKEQLDSLLGQTFQDWRLLVRDDGSTDYTVKIVKEYEKQYPEKIIFVEDKRKHLGACKSFEQLLEHSQADYIMFCDQDDVWLEGKLEATLAKMRELEIKYPGKPILVHTDLKVTDGKLNIISDSMWEYQKLDPRRKSVNYLLIQNNVTGCTVMINKKLKEIALAFPDEAIIHDWWLAIIASVFGEIGYANLPTILYRQHGRNDIGAKKYSVKYFVSRIHQMGKAQRLFSKVLKQSKALLKIYEQNIDEEKNLIIRCFSTLDSQGRFNRIKSIYRHRLTKSGLLRNLGYMVFVFIFPKSN